MNESGHGRVSESDPSSDCREERRRALTNFDPEFVGVFLLSDFAETLVHSKEAD